MKRRTEPPGFVPKFRAGQRVLAAVEAVKSGVIDPDDATGTVEFCSDVFVRVRLDINGKSDLYSLDFWEPLEGAAAADENLKLF